MRPDGGDQIAVIADRGAQGANPGFDDSEDEPLPARVNGRHGSAPAICNENRKAICDAHCECSIWVASNDCVTFDLHDAITRFGALQGYRLTPVHLRQVVEALGYDTERLGGAPDVFRHSAGIVSDRDREIQRTIWPL